jgi:hypothetical protein
MPDANLVVAYGFVLGSIPSKPWKQKTSVPNNVAPTQIFLLYIYSTPVYVSSGVTTLSHMSYLLALTSFAQEL